MKSTESAPLLPYLLKWLPLACGVAVLAGLSSALFLFALDRATAARLATPWLIWLLPVAGYGVAWVYRRVGRDVEAGNNLLIDQIHDPSAIVPVRMAPLILGATVISHLFGASVGREGTAVQMGGALADQFTRVFRLSREDRRILLMAGISAGFSSVFGTPLAGAVFGLEVLAIGRLRYDALLPCLIAAVVADRIGLLCGVHHTHYPIGLVPPLALWPVLAMLLAGAVFGLVAKVFAEATHALTAVLKRRIVDAPLRAFAGGCALAATVLVCGGAVDRYLGLGIPVIVSAFEQPLAPWDFAGKLVFTIASLASGFKGGEVTPLFFIGATLGNALAPVLDLPFALLAGIGFVAVFAGAANTPIASTLMAIELFGADVGVFAAIACVSSFLVSGHSSIYTAQRIGHPRRQPTEDGVRISDFRPPGRHRDRSGG